MATALTKEEGWGLAISVAGHAALLAVLLLRPAADNVVVPPERVEVTISEDVGLKSMSPDPAARAAPDEAPDIGEAAPAPEPVPLPPPPAPRVIEPPRPPAPRPVAKPLPKKPEPRKIEAKKPEPRKPPPRPSSPKPSAIDRIARASPVTAKPATKTPSAKTAPSKATTPPKEPGGTRFTDAFRQGTPGATSPAGTGAPAATIGPQQISALNAAIGRQLKPHWRGKAPEGAEAELLVTKVRFRLNRDGSLAGEPQVVATSGQTEANQPQVARHQEQAVRAVRLAAPFDLPEALYDGWKVVTTNFDRRLSQ
jgi:outer membrane biosynthesis protein TonB